MATVMLPRSLAALFPGAQRRVEVPGVTVGAVIEALDARWPGMRDRVCDGTGTIRAFIHVYVDGEPAELSTAVSERSVVHVIPAVGEGSLASRSAEPMPDRQMSDDYARARPDR